MSDVLDTIEKFLRLQASFASETGCVGGVTREYVASQLTLPVVRVDDWLTEMSVAAPPRARRAGALWYPNATDRCPACGGLDQCVDDRCPENGSPRLDKLTTTALEAVHGCLLHNSWSAPREIADWLRGKFEIEESDVRRALAQLELERLAKCEDRLWAGTGGAPRRRRSWGRGSRMLVPEKGLRDVRKNRQWLKLVEYLAQYGASQELCEEQAWAVLKIVEETK